MKKINCDKQSNIIRFDGINELIMSTSAKKRSSSLQLEE
jgi:hypothetical protein